jgi:exosortase A-associated hydrolase 1
MSDTELKEIPIVFQCEGDALVGIVHRPGSPAEIGIVTIIAGGPQYRAGVGRGMVSTARALAARGVPVLRFDYRGLGDGGGEFLGFEHIAEDIQAAVAAFQEAVPEVKKVVLWGGCDAASGAMIHGWKVPEVVSLVLGNPWVTTHEIHAAVMKKHYLSRLQDWSFWRKLLRFEYNLFDYAAAGINKALSRAGNLLKAPGGEQGSASDAEETGPFVDKMLDGLRRFDGPVLFLVSGQSVASREFDELLNVDPDWSAVYAEKGCQRMDFPEADQTFSDEQSRESVSRAISDWLLKLSAQ